MDFSEYRSLDATAMVAGVAAGDFKAADLIDAAARRLRRVNPTLNAAVLDLSGAARRDVREGLP